MGRQEKIFTAEQHMLVTNMASFAMSVVSVLRGHGLELRQKEFIEDGHAVCQWSHGWAEVNMHAAAPPFVSEPFGFMSVHVHLIWPEGELSTFSFYLDGSSDMDGDMNAPELDCLRGYGPDYSLRRDQMFTALIEFLRRRHPTG